MAITTKIIITAIISTTTTPIITGIGDELDDDDGPLIGLASSLIPANKCYTVDDHRATTCTLTNWRWYITGTKERLLYLHDK